MDSGDKDSGAQEQIHSKLKPKDSSFNIPDSNIILKHPGASLCNMTIYLSLFINHKRSGIISMWRRVADTSDIPCSNL